MSYPEVLIEFMLDCPKDDMHYFIYGLIKNALKRVYVKDKEMGYEEFVEKSSVSYLF